MPVTVKLIDLVKLRGSQSMWPERLRGLVEKLEEKPSDLTHWLVIADWFKEEDEPELEDALRWLARTSKTLAYIPIDRVWRFGGLPELPHVSEAIDRTTIPGAIAFVHAQLKIARNKAKAQLEELT